MAIVNLVGKTSLTKQSSAHHYCSPSFLFLRSLLSLTLVLSHPLQLRCLCHFCAFDASFADPAELAFVAFCCRDTFSLHSPRIKMFENTQQHRPVHLKNQINPHKMIVKYFYPPCVSRYDALPPISRLAGSFSPKTSPLHWIFG